MSNLPAVVDTRRDWRLRIAAALALLVVLFGIHQARPTATLETTVDALEFSLCVVASLSCFRAAAAAGGSALAFWAMFGLASTLWAGGIALHLMSSVPRASLTGRMAPGDLLFMISSVAFVVACALRPDRPRGGTGVAFDVTILAVLLLHTSLYFAVASAVTGGKLPDAWFVMWRDTRAAFVLFCAIWLVEGSRGRWRRTYLDLAAAIVLLFAGSAVVFRGVAAGFYHPGSGTSPGRCPSCGSAWWLATTATRQRDTWETSRGLSPRTGPTCGAARPSRCWPWR